MSSSNQTSNAADGGSQSPSKPLDDGSKSPTNPHTAANQFSGLFDQPKPSTSHHQRRKSVSLNPVELKLGGLKIPEEPRVWTKATAKSANTQAVIEEDEDDDESYGKDGMGGRKGDGGGEGVEKGKGMEKDGV